MAHPVRGAHTFLFEPGVWTSTGTLWRADGEPIVNCLLVRGEDDGAPPLHLDDAPRSA